MNPLDTEIRRAMGELANAAPPPRPPESFRTNIELTRTAATATSGSRGWLLAAAATVVIAMGGVAFVVATPDRSTTTVSSTPVTLAPALALTGDALLGEVSGRRWVALERFDDPSPSARTPEFTVRQTPNGPVIGGVDGCITFRGSVSVDQRSLDGEGVGVGTQNCEAGAVDSEARLDLFAGTIDVSADASTLLLLDPDGAPLARFHDLATVERASADDMPFTFLADELDTVTFVVSGVGFTECTRVAWEDSANGVSIELLETDAECPFGSGTDGSLAEVATSGAEVFVTSDGLLLANASSTLYLRRPPAVEPDPEGITLAAGSIFGIQPGVGVSPDDVLAEVVPRLGQPDVDTGWLLAGQLTSDLVVNPGSSPCSGTTDEYRELWWGDLSFGFWGSGSRTFLQFWNVGDRRRLAVGPDTPATPPTNPTNLTTGSIRVGDPAASIPDTFATDASTSSPIFAVDRFDPTDDASLVSVLSANPAFTPGSVAPPTRSGSYLVIDGVVVAFGAQSFTC